MSDTQAAGTKGPLSTVQLDITDERSIEQAVTFVHEKFGWMNALVDNAAVGGSDLDV